MARVKEFDRTSALQAAIVQFATHGYEGTSLDDLMAAMNVGRQSIYDTFGDKRQLYLAALKKYGDDSLNQILGLLEGAASPLIGISAVLLDFARHPRRLGTSSCLGVSSVCEFGRSDEDVAAINDEAGRLLEKAFERSVEAAIAKGEVDESVNARDAARFLSVTLTGLKVSADAGTSTQQLQAVARFALRTLAKT